MIKKVVIIITFIVLIVIYNIQLESSISIITYKTFYDQNPDENDELRFPYLIEEKKWGTGNYYSDKLGTVVNYFYKKDIEKGSNADVPTCFPSDNKKQYERLYRINFTKVWYFGIPYQNKTVICKI